MRKKAWKVQRQRWSVSGGGVGGVCLTTQTTLFPNIYRSWGKGNCCNISWLRHKLRHPCVKCAEGGQRAAQRQLCVAGQQEQSRGELNSWAATGEAGRRGGGASVKHGGVFSLTSARGRRRPGAVLQTPAPSDALHDVAAKARVHSHVPELEHCPPNHPVGHVEGGATGHPCTTAQMEWPTSYSHLLPPLRKLMCCIESTNKSKLLIVSWKFYYARNLKTNPIRDNSIEEYSPWEKHNRNHAKGKSETRGRNRRDCVYIFRKNSMPDRSEDYQTTVAIATAEESIISQSVWCICIW